MMKQKSDGNLFLFFGLSFLISWSVWIFQIRSEHSSQILFWVAGFGPTLAALILTAGSGGKTAVKGFLRRIFQWRAGLLWYGISLLGTPLVMLLALGVHMLIGGGRPQFVDPNHLVTSIEQWPGILIVFGYVFVFTALGEEPGWRGYALPRLKTRLFPRSFQSDPGIGMGVLAFAVVLDGGEFSSGSSCEMVLAASAWFDVLIYLDKSSYPWKCTPDVSFSCFQQCGGRIAACSAAG